GHRRRSRFDKGKSACAGFGSPCVGRIIGQLAVGSFHRAQCDGTVEKAEVRSLARLLYGEAETHEEDACLAWRGIVNIGGYGHHNTRVNIIGRPTASRMSSSETAHPLMSPANTFHDPRGIGLTQPPFDLGISPVLSQPMQRCAVHEQSSTINCRPPILANQALTPLDKWRRYKLWHIS